MNVLKTPTRMYHQVLELYRIKSEQQRRDRIISASVVLAVLALIYYFFT